MRWLASPSAAWQALGFFSQKLSPAQVNYSAFDRELLACVEAIRHFRFMLEGRAFTLFTDHKPLTFALHKVSEPWSARQSRHLSYVAEFTTDIQHVRLGRMLLAIFVTSHLAGCIWAIIGLREFQATFVSNTSEHAWSAYSWWAGDVLIIEGVATCHSVERARAITPESTACPNRVWLSRKAFDGALRREASADRCRDYRSTMTAVKDLSSDRPAEVMILFVTK
jgi:hypothetical protein